MSVKIVIFDGFSPMLDQIATINYGMGMDALDQASNTLRKSIRNAMSLSGSHDWNQSVVGGKRRIFRGARKATGSQMMSHRTGNLYRPGHMKSFITSWVSERHMTAVVGGMHKAYRPKMRRDGKVVGSAARVGGVSEATYGILQKLNDGGSYDSQSAAYKKSRAKSMEGFNNARYKPRRFVQKGRASAMPRVKDIMTRKLEMLIAKQINRTQVNVRVVA